MTVQLPRFTETPAAVRASARVLVTADRRLVGDAVSIALVSRGFDAHSTRLPVTTAQILDLRRTLAGVGPTVGLLISEVTDAAQLRDVTAVITGVALGWVVLCGSAPGPAWWALEDAGAARVLPDTTSLDGLVAALQADGPGQKVDGRPSLLGAEQDRASTQRHRDLAHQLERLSAREMQILQALSGGCSVKAIATTAGVSEGTVRAQVKSMLRKLECRTQLQAVAALRQANEWLMG